MEINLDSDDLWIGMKEYIEKMVKTLNVKVKPASLFKTPINKAINEDGTSIY